MGQNNQEYRFEYWATRSSDHSFPRSLAHFTHSLACGTVIDLMANYSVFFFILYHSGRTIHIHILHDKKGTGSLKDGITRTSRTLHVISPWNSKNGHVLKTPNDIPRAFLNSERASCSQWCTCACRLCTVWVVRKMGFAQDGLRAKLKIGRVRNT